MQLKLNSAEHLFALPALPRVQRGIAVLIAAAGLAACTHAQPAPEANATKPSASETAKPAEAAKDQTAEDYKAQGQAELDAALAKLRGMSVFFDFDAASLTKEAEDRLSEVAAILVRHPDLKVKIEGNADERGSEQYNLALGQRRAEAVKKYLANLGAKSGQVIAVSFGAEKPKDPGHNEEAWKQNRRADVDPTPVK
ncbi:MAG TPA: OmpA family protein [Myxococcales bacterium]|jgi:peptidoglycan-associated lipoprotein|nr:OmpA family protein [Myxococcales bacterium]